MRILGLQGNAVDSTRPLLMLGYLWGGCYVIVTFVCRPTPVARRGAVTHVDDVLGVRGFPV